MQIVGWIRFGDKAACGGVVAEGIPTHIRYGQPISFQGARISCKRNCVIAEGLVNTSVENGRPMSHHGHRSSAGCPIYSTMNDIDGVGTEGGKAVAEQYFMNSEGEWTPVIEPESNEAPYDEQPHLAAPPIEGVPYYIETMDGRTFSGRAGAQGLLPRIDTYGEDQYRVYWGDDALAKMAGDGA